MSSLPATWELDYYSRPILDAKGKKCWELLLISSDNFFKWQRFCSADNVNSQWLKQALGDALSDARAQGVTIAPLLRCWRSSMRTMVQRAAEPLGLEVIPSRRCYGLQQWLLEREASVYPEIDGYLQGPLAPPPSLNNPIALPLPEAVRGEQWSWANMPADSLIDANQWPIDFAGLIPFPKVMDGAIIPGVRLFSPSRPLALAGWLSGLEPVRFEVRNQQLVLEAGIEDSWLVSDLAPDEAIAAKEAFAKARNEAAGLQFLAVQSSETATQLAGFWMLQDLPNG
jgi:hypothetical protein